jgi:hypothetical protein
MVRNIQKWRATVTFTDDSTAVAEGLGESYVDRTGSVVTTLARDKFQEMASKLVYTYVFKAEVLDGDGLITQVKFGELKSIELLEVVTFEKNYDF